MENLRRITSALQRILNERLSRIYDRPKESARIFWSCCLTQFYITLMFYVGRDGYREPQLIAEYSWKYGLIALLLIAIYCKWPRPAWAVYGISAVTIALSVSFAVGKAISQEAWETGVNRGGYEWIPFGFVMYCVFALFLCGVFNIGFRMLFGKVQSSD